MEIERQRHSSRRTERRRTLIALPLLVERGQIRLVVRIARADDISRLVLPTILLALVSTIRIRVDTILGRIIAALVRAVRAVDCVEEVVERSAFDVVAGLVQRDGGWVGKRDAEAGEVERSVNREVRVICLDPPSSRGSWLGARPTRHHHPKRVGDCPGASRGPQSC